MAADFLGVVRGTSYFHLPDLLGRFFDDGRSYYVDFRGKVEWRGRYDEGVPVLHILSLKGDVFFPGMILQYGLGAIDRYFISGLPADERRIRSVASWLLRHCRPDGTFNNYCRELNSDESVAYYSNNSGMTQGQALSFLVRVLRHDLWPEQTMPLGALVERIAENLVLPTAEGGGTLYHENAVVLCEYCRRDEYVVLNGWAFALFGLWDYVQWKEQIRFRNVLDATVDTLARSISNFIVEGNNWTYYDNLGRLSSPVYHQTHLTIADVLLRLTRRHEFKDAHERIAEGFSLWNRIRYTLRKIVDKLRDPYRYTTAR